MLIYNYTKYYGFSLTELMITLIIMVILMLIALGSYQDAIRVSRRSEAHVNLIRMQLEQENFRMLNSQYATIFAGGINDVKKGTSDYYTFNLSNVSATTYTLKAQAIKGRGQYADKSCRTILLDQSGNKLPKICW